MSQGYLIGLCLPESKELSQAIRVIVQSLHTLDWFLSFPDLSLVLPPPLPRVQLGNMLPQEDRLPSVAESLDRPCVRQEALVLLDAALQSVVLVILELVDCLWNELHLQAFNCLSLLLDEALECLVRTVG